MTKLTMTLLALGLSGSLFAQMQTKTVSIFKNGQSFFAKEGTIQPIQGVYTISGDIPQGLFGTLWLVSKDGKIKQVVSSQDSVTQQCDAKGFCDLLALNIGASTTLSIWKGESATTITGTTEKVTKGANDNFVYFKTTEGQWLTLKEAHIMGVAFDQSPKTMMADKLMKPSVAVHFSDPAQAKHLGMVYLRDQLGWWPNYLIELQGEKKAKLTLRAEVVNDAEHIENATVNFVVGSPSFAQATRLSGLVDFSSSITYTPNDPSANIAYQQNVAYNGGGGGFRNDSFDFSLAEGVEGGSAEDLFFYTQKSFTLKKGQRAFFNLLEAEVEISHIYEADLSMNQVSSGYYQKQYAPISDELPKVYHSILLSNSTIFPWTTGTALVLMNDAKPISQDVLRYTPPKGEGTVRLTSAPDIFVNPSEKEAEREEQKLKGRNEEWYDLVTVDAQIKVKNYKTVPVTLTIKRDLQGEALKCNQAWTTTERLNLQGSINKNTQAKWEVSLKPGEEKIIEYRYKVYVGY